MQTSQLPLCVQYVQALEPPTFVAIVAAGIAGYIAFRQWRTAHDRLSFDLFEKRYAVYQATQGLISTLHTNSRRRTWASFMRASVEPSFCSMEKTRKFLMNIWRHGIEGAHETFSTLINNRRGSPWQTMRNELFPIVR